MASSNQEMEDLFSRMPPHLTAIIPRCGHVQWADSRAGKCLWEPVYHGITLGWEAAHHFLSTSQRDEMVLTSAQQVSLRTPSFEPPTTAGNLVHRGDPTSQSENTLFPNIRRRPSGSSRPYMWKKKTKNKIYLS